MCLHITDSKLNFYLHILKNLPTGVVLKKAFHEVKGKTLSTLGKLSANVFGTEISDEELLKAVSNSKYPFQTVKELQKYFRQRKEPRFFIDPAHKDHIIKVLQDNFPETIERTINDADQVCKHVFDLLGSGPTQIKLQQPTDSSRNSGVQDSGLSTNNYAPIDWHVDFKTDYRWNPETYYRDIKIPYGIADIKVPWELSRFQHLPTLGKASWITGQKSENNTKYAFEFMHQIDDWIEHNHPKFGVNWSCTMDVAIRAVNWLFGFYFFGDAEEIPDVFWGKFLKCLFLHGRFIRGNLEIRLNDQGERITGNHYLSNIVGLIFLGIFFNHTKEGKSWLEFGLGEFMREMELQVYPDGVDFESSIPYHRLVLELFVSPAILCKINDIDLPLTFWERLEKMFEFVMYYTKPDGTAPQIGDNDDGRLHILANYGNWPRLDHRYLLSIGATLYNHADFKNAAGEMHEEALWILGAEGVAKFNAIDKKIIPMTSKAFVDGGFYVMRHHTLYMMITCSPNNPNLPSAHRHNHSLGFDLYIDNQTFLVDPGSYIYTANPEWRNIFRSTSSHNTVSIDGQEQNSFFLFPKQLFSMQSDAVITVNEWNVTDEYDFFDAQHNGYERLPEPVIHRRQIFFHKQERYWVIKDILIGVGEHTFELYFHFAPMEIGFFTMNKNVLNRAKKIYHQLIDDTIRLDNSFVVATRNADGANLFIIPFKTNTLSVDILDGWVSSSGYGIKERASIVKYSKITQCPTEFLTLLLPVSERQSSG